MTVRIFVPIFHQRSSTIEILLTSFTVFIFMAQWSCVTRKLSDTCRSKGSPAQELRAPNEGLHGFYLGEIVDNNIQYHRYVFEDARLLCGGAKPLEILSPIIVIEPGKKYPPPIVRESTAAIIDRSHPIVLFYDKNNVSTGAPYKSNPLDGYERALIVSKDLLGGDSYPWMKLHGSPDWICRLRTGYYALNALYPFALTTDVILSPMYLIYIIFWWISGR